MNGTGEPEVPQEPTLGEQMGVGPHWAPGPVSWAFGTITDPLAGRAHVLILDSVGGRIALMFSPDDLRKLGAQCLEVGGGLVMPS